MTNAKPNMDLRVRAGVMVLRFMLMAALPILIFIAIGMSVSFPMGRHRNVVEDPGADFTRCTGLEWPTTTKIISVDDSHGGLLGDGEFHVIFDTDRATVENWIAESPPWDLKTWKRGPVPNEISLHRSFGRSSVGTRNVDGGPTELTGDPQLIELLTSNDIWYAARESCCASLRWHNGDLLIIDLPNNRVWLSSWDF